MNKNNYNFWKKGMVLAIICLFIGAGVIPSISGNFREDGNDSIRLESIKDVGQDDSETAASSQSIDWWPMFHHDLQHSGYSTSDAPETNNVKWTYTTGGNVWSSPAVADGKVYIGSWDAKVYCLDAETGNKIWSYTTGYYVYSSPAVADGKVYIGSYDHKVYCLDAATGDFIWSYSTGYPVYSSPAISDGKVYISSHDHKVYCLNADTGNEIWSYPIGYWVDSSPAISDGKVYIGSDDGKVYCLDAETGNKIWSYTTGDSVRSSPAISDGKVYIGSDDDKVYCFGYNPPDEPSYPSPENRTTDVERNVVLSWSGGDPDPADTVTYDVYFGNVSPPSKVVSNQSSTSYDPGFLDDDTTFFWRIVAWDNHGLSASGDLWMFSTGDTINHRPNTPGVPSGSSNGETNIYYKYKTSTTDPDGDDLYYLFDWGDESDSGWIGPYTSGDTKSADHKWNAADTYEVKVKAKDILGAESDWSPSLIVTIAGGNRAPDKPSTPLGPTSGRAGISYTYSSVTTDPDGDQVKYGWDWNNDSIVDDWTEEFADSGAKVEFSHKWDEKGTYFVKVKAQDTHGAESVWSDPLSVSMPKSKLLYVSLFWFFERFTGRYPWIKHLINIQDKNYTFSHQFCGSSEYGLTVSTRGWKHANQEGTAVTVYGDIDALSLWINLKGFFCYDTVDRGTTWQAYAYQTPEVGVDFLSKNFDYTITGLIRTNKYYYIAVGKNIITNEIKGADNRNSFIPGFPEVETSDADYGLTWMTPKGKLTHMGGASSCEVWFEYGTSEGNLNKESSHQTFTSVGEFSTTLDELTSCKTIYFTAVVSNDCGTTRGNTKNATPGKPNVATGSTSEQNTTSVYLNGNLNHLGGASSCEVWFEYGKFSDNLNKESSHQTFTSIGEFSIYITGLMRGETYYFRAVANNNVCRDYGNIESFTLTESYPPDMPTIVEGETFGVVNCYYRYVVTTTDPEHDRVKYYFDWGDGTGDWTDFCDSGDKGQDDHAWREPRVYEVRAKAKDEKGVESIWSRSLNVTIDEKQNNPPNKPSTPSGPTTGRAGVRYTYCTCATDPDGDQIAYYLWDWGDGENKRTTTWGPFDSGETVCENHTWSSRDRYEIIVWAVDVDGAISDSSDPLTVTLPKSMLGDKPKCCWSFQIFKNRFPWIGHISNIQNCSYILSHHFCSNSNSGDVEMKYYSP